MQPIAAHSCPNSDPKLPAYGAEPAACRFIRLHQARSASSECCLYLCYFSLLSWFNHVLCHSGLAAAMRPPCSVEGVQGRVQVLILTSQRWEKKEANRNQPPHVVDGSLFFFILVF